MSKRIFDGALEGAHKRTKWEEDVFALHDAGTTKLSQVPVPIFENCVRLATLIEQHEVSEEWFIDQRSPIWFALRENRITGSKLANIIGASRAGAPPRDVYRAWLGLLEDYESDKVLPNDNTEYGVLYEDRVDMIFRAVMFPLPMRQCGFFIHHKMKFMGVSPDGILGPACIVWVEHRCDGTSRVVSRKCKIIILEIKTSQFGVPKYPKTEHVIQTYQEMALSGATFCYLVYWTHDSNVEHLRIWRIDFIEQLWQWILHRATGFYDAVQSKTPLPNYVNNVAFDLYEHWYPYNPARPSKNVHNLPNRPPMSLVYDRKVEVPCEKYMEREHSCRWPKDNRTFEDMQTLWKRCIDIAAPSCDEEYMRQLRAQGIGYDVIRDISVSA